MRSTSEYRDFFSGMAFVASVIGFFPTDIAVAQPGQKASAREESPLAADDVSWLFPAPRNEADFSRSIAVRDLSGPDPVDPTKRATVWTDAAFAQFIANAESNAGRIPDAADRMNIPDEAKDPANWRIVGLRIDPGAPGLSPDIRAQFGQSPQIRLIAQPVVVKSDHSVKVFDMAAHLIYNFVSGVEAPARQGCFPRPQPDLAAFKSILADFAALRTRLAKGGFGGVEIVTAGRPLGVHPGLADKNAGAAVRNELKTILERHLSSARLNAMAIMTLPRDAPEPWMFLSMVEVPPGVAPQLPKGGFVPVRSPALDGAPFTEALTARGGFAVEPDPAPNNLNPITCEHGALTPPLAVAARKGAATAELFNSPPPSDSRVKQVVDLIADPARSHFFNTDCVSCHTETRRAMTMLDETRATGVDPAVLPKNDWNVRNFGWFPSAPAAQETATRRTAAETEAVLQFIEANGLLK